MQQYQPQPYIYESDPMAGGGGAPQGDWISMHKRPLILAGIGLLILALVIGVIIFFVERHRAQQALQEAQRVRVEANVIAASQECERVQNPEACLRALRQDLAEASGAIAYCEGLQDAAFDSCVTLAALASKDKEDCEAVQDEAKRNTCLQALTALEVAEEGTYEACRELPEGDRERCEAQRIQELALAGNCNEHVSDEACTAGAQVRSAIEAEDPDMCETVALSSFQIYCFEVTLPGDRDHDDLDANDEALYGTDDRNPDTDGDGYEDGIEIQTGYNPLGSG